MKNTLQQVRVVHAAFVTTWFLFVLVTKVFLSPPGQTENPPPFFPIVLGFVVVFEVGLALFLRARFIGSAEMALRVNSEDQAAAAKWRTGNLLSFCFAETATLFGVALRALGFEWKVVAIFFAVGLVLILSWTPKQIQITPRGVR